MTVGEVRKKYLEYMKGKGHVIVPSTSLVPENDPTTLFTGSGMQPMVPYLLGERHPAGKRVANSEKCFRAEDIDEVGDNRHTTFFEMLGNWSFGDYFRKEQIKWMADFLFDEIKIDPNKVYGTCFAGDEKNKLPKDTESEEIWRKIFADRNIAGERIFYYDSRKNWWSRAGMPDKMPVGEPGGPDSEMFYDYGVELGLHEKSEWKKVKCHLNCDCGRFMEIGNNVFMTYKKTSPSTGSGRGSFEELPRKNVDFGGGLERITSSVNNDSDVFKLDVFSGFIHRLSMLARKEYANSEYTKSFRIVADHTRAAILLIADGVRPANTERGYVLRRLIRRAVRHVDKLGVNSAQVYGESGQAFDMYKDIFGYADKLWTDISHVLAEEEQKFRATLKRGLHEFEKGERDAFVLFTTYGFPFELSAELATEKSEKLDEADFKKKMNAHAELSRAGSLGKFKGGLSDTSDMSVKYHTATHLLQQALRVVLGKHVCQKGSNITPERLRFDFSHDKKMTDEEKKKVEEIVNNQIEKNLAVTYQDLPLAKAEKLGAIGLFEEKYGDKVRVYKIGAFSLEYCGGPHMSNTSELANPSTPLGVKMRFRILKEEAVSSGVRRIKAVL